MFLESRSGRPFYNRVIYVLALPLLIFCGSCGNKGEKAPDVSGIKINLQTYRFDLDLYSIDTNHIGAGLQQLKAKYPDFLDYYLDTVRAYGIHGNYNDTVKGIRSDLRTDLTFKDFAELEDTIRKDYPNKQELDDELTFSFKLVKYYMPSAVIPKIIYLNMGLSKWPSFPIDNATICVGLDMFLGDLYPHYKDVGVPSYMAAHFRKNYVPVSVLNTYYQIFHPFTSDDKTLLDLMLQRGKEQYFLHKVLPNDADTVLFGFTKLQLDWCTENEGLVYNFFIHQNLLYNKEGHSIMPYVYDGPFAKDLESPTDIVKYTPGNIGSWMGYRIVCAYMAQHPETTLKELSDMQTAAPNFLEEAHYRPK